MSDTFVVVGGDAAGMSAASKAKRDAPDLEVVVFEKGQYVSYGACGLPYYIKGEIEGLEDLVSMTAAEFREERDIDVRTGHEVVALDPGAKTVTVEGPDERFEFGYDVLCLATGADATVPPIEGVDLDGVYTLRSLDAARAIREDLDRTDGPERVALVGGGYIGLEMAGAFRSRGLDVDLFEMESHVLAPFGADVATTVEDHLRENDVTVHLDAAVDRLDGLDGGVSAVVSDGERYDVDLVLLGVGATPAVGFAADAGIELGSFGGVVTDDYGRTNVDGVYAAGDCAEMVHAVTGEQTHLPLALPANRAGRAVGQTVAGDPAPVGVVVGTAVTKVFDLQVGRTGVIDHEQARRAGFDPISTTVHSGTRAFYYPGSEKLYVHVTADRESGRLLGMSMVGGEGAAKRIDTAATAIQSALTVSEVEYLDLGYSPPFSPVWNPVLTAVKAVQEEF